MAEFNLGCEVSDALDSCSGDLQLWATHDPKRLMHHVIGYVLSSARQLRVAKPDVVDIAVEVLRQVTTRIKVKCRTPTT